MDPNFSTNINNVFINLRSDNDIGTQLDEVVSAMKEIKRINISASNAENVCDFSCLNTTKASLDFLMIQGRTEYGLSNNIFRVIEYHGKTLTIVHFSNVSNFNLTHLLHHCPHLMDLSLDTCSLLDDDDVHMRLDPLKEMRELMIVNYSGNVNVNINEYCWLALLAEAKKLNYLDLTGYDGKNLKRALKKVYKRHNFPSLNHFGLTNVNALTLTDLLPMIEHSKNPLEQVIIHNCNDIGIDDFNNYEERMTSKFGNIYIHFLKEIRE